MGEVYALHYRVFQIITHRMQRRNKLIKYLQLIIKTFLPLTLPCYRSTTRSISHPENYAAQDDLETQTKSHRE